MRLATALEIHCPVDISDLIDAFAELRDELPRADEHNHELQAEIREVDEAFEELAMAARHLLHDLAEAPFAADLPPSAHALADLITWRDDARADETANTAGEES